MILQILTFVTLITSPVEREVVIAQFAKGPKLDWQIINDGVMGGLSQSTMTTTDRGTGIFQGDVSLKNNGGFASARALTGEMDLSGLRAVKLRVKGDGQTYSVRFRTNRNFDGVSYVANFSTTDGEWEEHVIKLDAFTPQFRGRMLGDQPVLKGENIQQIGILISDKQEGAFRLEIEWVKGVLK